MKRILLISATTLFFTCCNKSTDYLESLKPSTEASEAMAAEDGGSYAKESRVNYTEPEAEEESQKIPEPSRVIEKTDAQIIRNASVQFQVKDIDASHQKIAEILKQYHAYFGSDNKTNNGYQIEDNLIIRVPAKDFDLVLEAVMQEAVYTNYKNISAEDVTAEFVDVQARLKTKKEVEARYIALLKQAGKVSDILEVEDKLRVIREEIESTEGRLKLLKDQVGYSTITLSMYQKLDYSPEPAIGFLSNLKEAFVRGWRSLVDFTIVLVRVWPFLIIWAVVLFFVYRKWMKKK